jgi:pimeloyl-ACP methyl ester carboxylesterase
MSLYVREEGPRDAPTVLFLHGLGLSHTMWRPQFEGLSDSYHCLAPDLPECGNSTATGPFTLKDASRRVVDIILERVPGGSAHVVGLSIGGAVALQILRDEPHVLDHLMISGTAFHVPPLLDTLNRLDEQTLRLFNHDRLAEYLLQPYRIPQTYRNLLLTDLRKLKPEAMRHVIQEMTKIQLPREGQVPTLIAVGQEEAFVIKHDAYEIRSSLHCARGVLVPGVGHFWNLEAPDMFTKTLSAWIQDRPLPTNLAQLGIPPSF